MNVLTLEELILVLIIVIILLVIRIAVGYKQYQNLLDKENKIEKEIEEGFKDLKNNQEKKD